MPCTRGKPGLTLHSPLETLPFQGEEVRLPWPDPKVGRRGHPKRAVPACADVQAATAASALLRGWRHLRSGNNRCGGRQRSCNAMATRAPPSSAASVTSYTRHSCKASSHAETGLCSQETAPRSPGGPLMPHWSEQLPLHSLSQPQPEWPLWPLRPAGTPSSGPHTRQSLPPTHPWRLASPHP